jgi:hypothetical protein
LTQGPNEEKIRKLAEANKMPLPEAIANKPDLRLGLRFYFNAFLDLTSDRAIGMAEGPIYWTSIRSYADRFNLDGFEFDRFVHLVRALDSEYLDYRSKSMKK